jgi:Arginosuccinate synthase N-terminal HUP domain
MSRTAVVAFSGGLDTSCIVSWLLEDYGFDSVPCSPHVRTSPRQSPLSQPSSASSDSIPSASRLPPGILYCVQ